MNLLAKQIEVKDKIIRIATAMEVDPVWAVAVAMVESSLGMHQKSPTGCRGVFQMSRIAMMDLLQEMETNNSERVDIACGVAFLYLLLGRHKTIKAATEHFCDPKEKAVYVTKMLGYMKVFQEEIKNENR